MKKINLTLKPLLYSIGIHALLTSSAIAGPINQECEGTTNPNSQDCTNDPFMISYEMDYMNFSRAWDKSYGTARVAIIDDYINNNVLYSTEFGSRLRKHNIGHFSRFYANPVREGVFVNFPSPAIGSVFFPGGAILNRAPTSMHGDLILSLLGSKANSGIGMASTCRECSLSFYTAREEYLQSNTANNTWEEMVILNQHFYKALKVSVFTGNQIINKSGFFSETNFPKCSLQNSLHGGEQPICDLLRFAKEFDTIIVASNGNNRSYTANWPANEKDMVIGVGGTDVTGQIWDDFRDDGICAILEDCGSQGNHNSIMAPASDVMVYHHNGSYNPALGCSEFSFSFPGYQTCSGTSFSAPIITGVISIMRSLNPLLSFDEVRHVLENSRVFTNNEGVRYSIPNISTIIKNDVMGQIGGSRVLNRLKPMFRLNTQFSHSGTIKNNYLSTSIPQVAVAGMYGNYLADVNEQTGFLISGLNTYNVDSSEPLAVGYSKFREPNAAIKPNNARAPFYIFGGHENPFTGVDDMIPLHHQALKPVLSSQYPECYDRADHAYSTTKVTAFGNPFIRCNTEDTRYVWEGIEGYLLPNCPQGQTCYEDNNNPNSAQCLMLRYSSVDDSYALLMESELQKPKFSSYTGTADHLYGMSDAECLGYVYPNVDSDNDLIIDGMELILGTNPNDADTDNDGYTDGEEYPPTSPIVSDPLDVNSI